MGSCLSLRTSVAEPPLFWAAPASEVLKSCFVTTTRLSFVAFQKDAAGAALKKAAPALGFGQQKNRLRLHPKSGGPRRLRLRNTAANNVVFVCDRHIRMAASGP